MRDGIGRVGRRDSGMIDGRASRLGGKIFFLDSNGVVNEDSDLR